MNDAVPTPHAATDQASAWVTRFAPLIPEGEVLDLACGGVRHARLLARLGYPVLAVDRDAEALAALAGEGIRTLLADLEQESMQIGMAPFESGRFSGIVVTNYLHRPLFPLLLQCLAPGGMLIYETFADGNQQFGKPSNPAFLLKPGELLDLARSAGPAALRVLAYEDGYTEQPRPAMVQRICGIAPGSALPPLRLRVA
jgi:SAM-dependent methyltransferase